MGTVYRKAPSAFSPQTSYVPVDMSAAFSQFPISGGTASQHVPFNTPRTLPPKRPRAFRMLPAVFVTIGSMLIANVMWPILSYQLFVSPNLQERRMVSPVDDAAMMDTSIANTTLQKATDDSFQQVPSVQAVESAKNQQLTKKNSSYPEPRVIEEELDYTNLSQWFPWQDIPQVKPEDAVMYSIDIPALDIYNASVKIGGLNLDQNLVQYPGTANPGELGSPVIFGHSVSPLFYNPAESNSRRYISIFTKIMSLKKDDKIVVRFDGITYTYRVNDKIEVKPDDTYILSQRHDSRELKLVTCTPPGTYLKRGIVFAQLEQVE